MKVPKKYEGEEIIKYKNYYRKRNYDSGDFGDGKRKLYTERELKLILKHEIPDRELAKQLNRSVLSIQVARCRYGKDRDE